MGKLINLNKKMYHYECKEGNYYMVTDNQGVLNKFYSMRFTIISFNVLDLDKSLINFNERGVV